MAEEGKRQGVFDLINAAMFRQLERLECASGEELAAEISRSKEVRGVMDTTISNVKTMMEAARAMDDTAEAVQVPKGLLGR